MPRRLKAACARIEVCRITPLSSIKTRMAVFGAKSLRLPGCYSQGETVDILKENIREAIAGVLEVLKLRAMQA